MHGTCVFAGFTFLIFKIVLQNRPVISLIHHIQSKVIISLIKSWIVGIGDPHFELFGDKHNMYEVTENSLFIFAVIGLFF